MNTAPNGGRKTICVSTQAGCAMGCVFCVTGQFGFARNLEAGEIVEQVLRFSDQRAARSPTWCSWAWASRWPTTTRRCARSGC